MDKFSNNAKNIYTSFRFQTCRQNSNRPAKIGLTGDHKYLPAE